MPQLGNIAEQIGLDNIGKQENGGPEKGVPGKGMPDGHRQKEFKEAAHGSLSEKTGNPILVDLGKTFVGLHGGIAL